jgi:hypothetical protein
MDVFHAEPRRYGPICNDGLELASYSATTTRRTYVVLMPFDLEFII